jgi:hypothetical protein
MKIWVGMTLLLMSLAASRLRAEPYLAAWEGVNCNACHMNQTGGYIRDDFGRNYGNDLKTFDWQGIAETAQAITHKTPTWISAGVDLHESFGAFFTPGVSGPQFNPTNSQSPFGALGRQSFSIAIKANEVVTGVFTYRLDLNDPQEVFALISGLPSDAYLKLGKFVTPYGLELADDDSLVRNDLVSGGVLTFNSSSNTQGAEFGIYPEDLFLNAAVFNDSANTGEMDFSAKGGLNARVLTLGGTVYGQNLAYGNSVNNTSKLRYGAYGWTKLGPAVVLAEYDSGYDTHVAAPSNATAVSPGTLITQNYYSAYHASVEFDLGRDIYLRFVNEFLNDSFLISTFDGFRDVVSLRFYPVRNLKCQLDVQRMDPATGSANYGTGPYYGAIFDTYMFY